MDRSLEITGSKRANDSSTSIAGDHRAVTADPTEQAARALAGAEFCMRKDRLDICHTFNQTVLPGRMPHILAGVPAVFWTCGTDSLVA